MDDINVGLLEYRINETLNQGKLNEATIGAHGNRINQLENKAENMQRTINLTEDDHKRINLIEKRLDEYDSWRRALLWTSGKLYALSLAIGGGVGFLISLMWERK